jgi:hypothetical protein
MSKTMMIASSILFVLSLGGVVAAGRLPNQIEREDTLVNYQQQGKFDYSVQLKPSYLFGPPPQPVPLDATYPAEIVTGIDFVFTFVPAKSGPTSASAELVLENPGLWVKRIPLSPSASIDGTSALAFSVDMSRIGDLFTRMEEEVKTASSPRRVTIMTTVTTANQTVVQSLPLGLTDTVIDVDPGLVKAGPLGTGRYRYSVNLKPNSIFDSPKIESPPPPVSQTPTALTPGQPVFGKLVDTMNASFEYKLTSDKPMVGTSSYARITAVLEANRLWSKEFVLFSGSKAGSFNISLPVELGDYLALLDAIRTETGAPAEGYALSLVASVTSLANTDHGRINGVFTQTLKGVLKDNVLQWDNALVKTEQGSIKQTSLVPNTQTNLGLSIRGMTILTMVLAIVLGGLFGFSLIAFIKRRPTRVSFVEREVARIAKRYGQRMADGKSRGATVLALDSMEDLARVADELGKPILHETPETPDAQHAYLVIDGPTTYRFGLSANGHGDPTGLRAHERHEQN